MWTGSTLRPTKNTPTRVWLKVVRKKGEKQAVAFLDWLRGTGGMKGPADGLQIVLANVVPDPLPELLPVWQQCGV